MWKQEPKASFYQIDSDHDNSDSKNQDSDSNSCFFRKYSNASSIRESSTSEDEDRR